MNGGSPEAGPIFSPRRLWHLFRKEMMETFRDWKMLSLTLSFAPFFVLLMYGYLGHVSPVYRVGVVNSDTGGMAELAIQALSDARTQEGVQVLRVREVSASEVERLLQEREVDLAVFIPAGLSTALTSAAAGSTHPGTPRPILRTRGDPANPDYMMAAVWTDMSLTLLAGEATGQTLPFSLVTETVAGTASVSDFDLYVPGLLGFALMMLMFTAAAALIREKDRGTLIRLRLSNLSVAEWLTAVSATQVLVGVLALALTYLTAWLVGYRSAGSLGLILAVGALTSLAIMAFSVLVAAFLRTVFDLVTVGCFPFFILMFFSGGMFPLPGLSLFQVGGHEVEVNEILPTTHAIKAMEEVLTFGAGPGEIAYELGAVAILTLVLYVVGIRAFTHRHMTPLR